MHVVNALFFFTLSFKLHDFEFAEDFEQLLKETLPVLNELRRIGKVRYIGINSYSLEKLK